MRGTFVLAIVAVVPGVVASPAGAGMLAARYFVTDLSAGLASPAAVQAVAVNSFGQVVLNASTTGSGYSSLWTPATANAVDGTRVVILTPIVPATPPGPFGGGGTAHPASSYSFGMNSFGQVVGVSELGAFQFTPSSPHGTTGQTATFKPVASATSTAARAINSRGDVVVTADSVDYLYSADSPNTGAVTLKTLPAGMALYSARAINDAGEIGASSSATIGKFFRPSEVNGSAGTVSDSPGILDLNNTGLAAGAGGVFRIGETTPTVTQLTSGSFRAVSDSGIAVGALGKVWSAADGTVDLNGRLEPHSGAQWSLSALYDINASGQIVGEGSFDPDNNPATQNSVTRGILLTPLIDGDATIDQRVDFADLVVLAQHYGQTTGTTWQTGDFDGNNAVDFADLVTLAQHYGAGSVNDSGFAADWSLAQSMVPEPAALSVLLGTTLFARRRR